MINLSETQFSIVEEEIGIPIQVLASAGSGKTRVLTARVRHILENTRKDGVIALTFTNKAAEELQTRLEDIEDLENRAWISTIHAIAQRILEQYGHTIGLPSDLHIYERDQDRKTVFLQSLREGGVDIDTFLDVPDEKTRKNRERIIQNYMEHFSIVKRSLLTEDDIREQYSSNERFFSVFQAYQTALIESGGIDFDDILVYAHRILLEQPWCGDIYRAKFKHVCVDEAQDLNKAQYEFIKALCADKIKSLMMVGDPNQMIYGFNGSSHEYLCTEFINDFSPKKFVLNQNYRSSKAVIHLANKLIPGSQVEAEFALEGQKRIEEFPDEESEADWIIASIHALLDLESHPEIEGEISLNKMVVIARNRFVFNTLQKKLNENQIPFSLKKGERQVEPSSLFGKVLDLSIRLKINPKDWVDGKKLFSALNLSPPSQWANENILNELSQQVSKSDIIFNELISDLLSHIDKLDIDEPNIPKLCKNFENELEIAANQSTEDNELAAALQELRDFSKNWTTFKRKGLGNSLLAFRNAMALGQLTEEYDPSGLTLSTVHTMKGLEKDIVFLMGMCEGVFPDYRAKSKHELEEEKNNAFVAVTRSRRWIYITYPRSRLMPWGDVKTQATSRFVLTMQE
ncbi:ATP-dependent helicase [Methylophaga thalassica]|uniref:ATP-dependent helicase n=1 Tax=Methylophaga aminisulfidivorans TaxID=230105 RepID=UPI003A8EC71F